MHGSLSHAIRPVMSDHLLDATTDCKISAKRRLLTFYQRPQTDKTNIGRETVVHSLKVVGNVQLTRHERPHFTDWWTAKHNWIFYWAMPSDLLWLCAVFVVVFEEYIGLVSTDSKLLINKIVITAHIWRNFCTPKSCDLICQAAKFSGYTCTKNNLAMSFEFMNIKHISLIICFPIVLKQY